MAFNADRDYPPVKDCFQLQKQIQILENDINFYAMKFNSSEVEVRKNLLKKKLEQFQVMQCPAKVDEKIQSEYRVIYDKYADDAKTRIEADSFNTRYVYIGFGAAVLITALFFITKKRKK